MVILFTKMIHRWIVVGVRSLLLSLVILVIVIGGWIGAAQPAIASIRELQEAPGQLVYQSRSTLVDQHGNRWQAIAFQRVHPDRSTNTYLRLVGFPGTVTIDRTQPLIFTNSMGGELQAPDASSQVFTDAQSPEAMVGQYDLEPILLDLYPEFSWRLTLATADHEPRLFSAIPSAVIEEWQTIGKRSPS